MHSDTSSLLLHFLLHFFYTSLAEAIQAAPLSIAQEVLHVASVIIRACSGVIIHSLHFSYTSLTEAIQAAPLSIAQEVHHVASVIIRARFGVMMVCVLIHVMRMMMGTVVSVHFSTLHTLLLHFSLHSPYNLLTITLIHSLVLSSGVLMSCVLNDLMRIKIGIVVSVHFYISPRFLHSS